jgi:hypothetical protein
MAKYASGAQIAQHSHLRWAQMSNVDQHNEAPLDLDATEAELAEVELMLERLDTPSNH